MPYGTPTHSHRGSGSGISTTIIQTLPIIYMGPVLPPNRTVFHSAGKRQTVAKERCGRCGDPRTARAMTDGICTNVKACDEALRTRGY